MPSLRAARDTVRALPTRPLVPVIIVQPLIVGVSHQQVKLRLKPLDIATGLGTVRPLRYGTYASG